MSLLFTSTRRSQIFGFTHQLSRAIINGTDDTCGSVNRSNSRSSGCVMLRLSSRNKSILQVSILYSWWLLQICINSANWKHFDIRKIVVGDVTERVKFFYTCSHLRSTCACQKQCLDRRLVTFTIDRVIPPGKMLSFVPQTVWSCTMLCLVTHGVFVGNQLTTSVDQQFWIFIIQHGLSAQDQNMKNLLKFSQNTAHSVGYGLRSQRLDRWMYSEGHWLITCCCISNVDSPTAFIAPS
jgi:hypothetical protein